MTRSPDQTEGLSGPDAKVLNDIKDFGWHVVSVGAVEGESGPDWAFSIGLHQSFGHPEIVIFGLPLKTCSQIVNAIGKSIKSGAKYQSKGSYPEILQDPYMCSFREVLRKHYGDYVGYALWFYGDDSFPLLQCFWPDKQGRFPWEEACNEYVKKSQPLLYLP